MNDIDTRHQVKNLARNSLIYNIGNFLPIIVNFLLIPLYTRYLTTADYGIISIADIITKIMTIILAMGLPIAIVRFYHDFKDSQANLARYLGAIISWIMLIGIIITGALHLWGQPLFGWLINGGELLFNPYIVMAIWTSFFALTTSIVVNWFQAQNKPWQHIALSLISFLALTSLTIYFVVVNHEGALGAVKAGLIAAIILFVLLLPMIMRMCSFNLSKKIILPSLKFSLPLIPAALASWLLIFIDRIILKNYTTLEDVGVYSLGYSAGMVMMLIVASIHKAWAPFFFEKADQNQNSKLFGKITSYYVAIILFIGLIGSLFSRELIILITTPAYYGAAAVVPLVILGYVLYGFYTMSTTPLFYKKKTSLILVYVLVAAIVNIILNLWWIPTLGMMGAAYATTVSYFVLFLLGWWGTHRSYVIPYEYIKLLGILVMAGIVYAVPIIFFPSSIPMKIGALAVYVICLWGFGIINKSNINKMHKIFIKK